MRIGMILDTSFPPDPRVENEAISLIEAGHQVFLFSLSYKRLPAEEVINGINVKRYFAGRLIYKFSALAYTFPFYHKLVAPKISEFLKKNSIEVIHVHDMLIAQAVFEVNKTFNLPVILDLHENRPAIMAFYQHVKSLSGKLLIDLKKWEKKQKEFIHKADKVILVTEEAKIDFINRYKIAPDKITVVPNTVTGLFFKYPIDQTIIEKYSGRFTILYLGDTGLRRGTGLAIKSLMQLKTQIPNLKLVLVGKSKEDTILKQLTKDLNIEEIVDFEGWQDLAKFPSYILASDVCISPLYRNQHHDTTYANKIFQYMAMGKPVIVSDCTAQAKVIEEEEVGFVHEAGNEKDLAEKILQLYNNPGLKKKFGENAKASITHKYNWAVTSRELVRLYKELEQN